MTHGKAFTCILTPLLIEACQSQIAPLVKRIPLEKTQPSIFQSVNQSSYANSRASSSSGLIQQQANTDLINVKSFGAVGDGSNDDTAAIRAAVAYASTYGSGNKINGNGGTIFFPTGRYKVTSTISIPPGLNFQGEGMYDSALASRIDVYGCSAFSLEPNAANISIKNMCFRGVSQGKVPTQAIVNSGANFFEIAIEDCLFVGFTGSPIQLDSVNKLSLRNVWLNQNNAGTLLTNVDGIADDCLFEGKDVSDYAAYPDFLLSLSNSPGFTLQNCQFERGRTGVRFDGKDLLAENCSFFQTFLGFDLGDSFQCQIDHSQFESGCAIPVLDSGVNNSYSNIPLLAYGPTTSSPSYLVAEPLSNSDPVDWQRRDGGATNAFLSASPSGPSFSTNVMPWVYFNYGSDGSIQDGQSPEVDLGTPSAGHYVLELVNSGNGIMALTDGTQTVFQEDSSPHSFLNRKSIGLSGGSLRLGLGTTQLGSAFYKVNLYKNYFGDDGFDKDTNDTFTVINGATGFQGNYANGGAGKAFSLTNGTVQLNPNPTPILNAYTERGFYYYVEPGSSLALKTKSNLSNLDGQLVKTFAPTDSWRLFRTVGMTASGPGSDYLDMDFVATGTVIFDDSFCLVRDFDH